MKEVVGVSEEHKSRGVDVPLTLKLQVIKDVMRELASISVDAENPTYKVP